VLEGGRLVSEIQRESLTEARLVREELGQASDQTRSGDGTAARAVV